jgi:hypothetical protein
MRDPSNILSPDRRPLVVLPVRTGCLAFLQGAPANDRSLRDSFMERESTPLIFRENIPIFLSLVVVMVF